MKRTTTPHRYPSVVTAHLMLSATRLVVRLLVMLLSLLCLLRHLDLMMMKRELDHTRLLRSRQHLLMLLVRQSECLAAALCARLWIGEELEVGRVDGLHVL